MKRFSSSIKAPIMALHAIAVRCPQNQHLDHLEKVLGDLLEKEKESILTPDRIIKESASYFGIRVEDLLGKSQQREFVQPRQICMFLCRELLTISYQTIGRIFGRDHSTVITSVRQVQTLIENKDPHFTDSVESLLKRLMNRGTRTLHV
jgi:chromosomal replication initiator protein